ncbi:MAG TPA: hypothetical protein DD728_11515 [Hyphomonas atlantica]|uniref:Uncharacterized protein n=1 Tax=Hyphomonas atlantica TaxID=1280948 RepID=A0A356W786_9PROT|nr:hypothetical protein [Hyphomonas atlantica]
MQGWVHQVRAAGGEAVAINAQVQAWAEQAAILHLAGHFAIADAGRAGRAGGEARDVYAVQSGRLQARSAESVAVVVRWPVTMITS